MDSKLYFVSDKIASVMNETKYEQEADLQELIKDNPELVRRSEQSPELYFAAKELGMSETPGSSKAFVLDLFMVDATGMPTLVEVKRSSDTRLKREVVGQLLDYATCITTCDMDAVRRSFEDANADDQVLCISTDEFWETVRGNLQRGKMNLVFAADKIPEPLERMIYFLDASMPNICVYGAVIQQYLCNSVRLLATNIVNIPVPAESAPARAEMRDEGWSDEAFAALLSGHKLDSVIPLVENICSRALAAGLTIVRGRGTQVANLCFRKQKRKIFNISAWYKKSIGYICTFELDIKQLALYAGSIDKQDELRARFSKMPSAQKYRSEGLIWDPPKNLYIDLRSLADPADLDCLLNELLSFCDEID